MPSKPKTTEPEAQDVIDDVIDSTDVQDADENVDAPSSSAPDGATHTDPQGHPVTIPAGLAAYHEERGYTPIG